MATSPEKPTNNQAEKNYQAEQLIKRHTIGGAEVTVSTQSIESPDQDNYAFATEDGVYGVAIGEHGFSAIENPSRNQLQSMAAREVAAFIKESIQGESANFIPAATLLEASDGFAWAATDKSDNTGILQVKLDQESNQLDYKRLGAKGSPKSGVIRPEAGMELILSDNQTLDSLTQSGNNPADYEAAKQVALDSQRDVPMISVKPSDELVKSMHDAYGGSRRRAGQSRHQKSADTAKPSTYDPRPTGSAGIMAPAAVEVETSEGADALSPQGLEDLRQAQSAAMSDYVLQNYSRGIPKAKQDFIDSQLAGFNQDYLASVGINPDSPDYEAALGLIEQASITADYQTSLAVDNRAEAKLDDQPQLVEESPIETPVYVKPALTAAEQAELDSDSDREVDPAVAKGYEKLDRLRDELAVLSAQRQGRIFGNSEKYQAKLDEYNQQLIKLGKMSLGDTLNDAELTDSQKNLATISYLFAEQAKLREATKENLKNTPVGKFTEWFNRGNKWQRFGKAAAVAGAGVVAAAGVGALAGVAGVASGIGVAAAVGIGAKSTTRFATGFARRDNSQGRGIQQLEQADHQVAAMAHMEQAEDRLDGGVDYFNTVLENDTKQEQSKRRRSVRAGLAGVALGAAIGGAAAYGISELADGDWGNRNSPFNRDSGAMEAPVETTPESEPADDYGSDYDDDGSSQSQPESSPEEVAPEQVKFPEAAFEIDRGEGFYKTFQDMGIPKQDWVATLEKVGPELNQKGWAYKMPNGEWGIPRTGRFPESVLQLIQDSRK